MLVYFLPVFLFMQTLIYMFLLIKLDKTVYSVVYSVFFGSDLYYVMKNPYQHDFFNGRLVFQHRDVHNLFN